MDGISIVIPSGGNKKDFAKLLRSIEHQKISFPIEIIIVKNNVGVNDNLNVVSALGSVKCLRILEKGVNLSRNVGLDSALYDLVFFTDDDCVLDDPLLLEKHYRLHLQKENLFGVGGGYALAETASFFSKVYQEIQMRWLYKGIIDVSVGRETNYLIGGHFSVKNKFVKSGGLIFDPRIVYGGSELSFFAQARALNLTLELHDMCILHLTHESFFSLHRKLFKQGRGQAVTRLNPGSVSRSNQTTEPSTNFFLSYFSFVFWWGYFYQLNQKMAFLSFLYRPFKNALIDRRHRALMATQQAIEAKKQRGDRL